MSDLISFFDSKTWFLMLISLVIVVAYFVFLFSNNTNTQNVQTFFNLVCGYWFGTGSVSLGARTAIQASSAK